MKSETENTSTWEEARLFKALSVDGQNIEVRNQAGGITPYRREFLERGQTQPQTPEPPNGGSTEAFIGFGQLKWLTKG